MAFDDDNDMIDFGFGDEDDVSESPIGETHHDERGDFDLGDANPEIDPDYNFPARDAGNTRPSSSNNGENPKKVALIGIGMGIVILIICFALYSGYKAYQSKKAEDDANLKAEQELSEYFDSVTSYDEDDADGDIETSNSEANQSIKENNNYEEVPNTNMSDNAQTILNQQQTSNSETALDGWVKFTSTDDLTFEGTADSAFTVTNIEYFAKVVNSQNDKIVKCVLEGNISGLVGTYEVEVPYSESLDLSVGNILNIRYTYHVANGVVILGEVIFI